MSESAIGLLGRLVRHKLITIFSLKRFEDTYKSYLIFVEYRGVRGILHLHKEEVRIRDTISNVSYDKDKLYHINSKLYYKFIEPDRYGPIELPQIRQQESYNSFEFDLYSREYCIQIYERFKYKESKNMLIDRIHLMNINAVYKQYQQTEHFDTTLLSC